VLLSEGSSLSARETITALGLAGYTIDVCDPDPLCLGRCSWFVRHFFQCPALGTDPIAYLRFVLRRLHSGETDVLLPVHEQAFLFARARPLFPAQVGLAVADFASFLQLQGKVSFARLLAKLAIPHPPTQFIRSEAELVGRRTFPYFVKTDYGTASIGVWRVGGLNDLAPVIGELQARNLLDGKQEVLLQEAAPGQLERVQAVFDSGRLVALHGYQQRGEGPRGGDLAKTSIFRPVIRNHVDRLGKHLRWHGALSLDYCWEEKSGQGWFIDANPRLVEPMNALWSGTNLAAVLIKVSLGEHLAPLPPGREGVRTHLALMALLEAATQTRSRRGLLREARRLLWQLDEFANSREELTPGKEDPLSLIPLLIVFARLLLDPGTAETIGARAVHSYSLTDAAVRIITNLDLSRWPPSGALTTL